MVKLYSPSIIIYSVSSGQGRHWFVVYRSSNKLEIFDSLGCELQFLKNFMKIPLVYEYNVTPVQCKGSQICGAFVLYFIIFRYYNLDQEFSDFLNNFFTKDCSKNEFEVAGFLKSVL